jgi:hypothetical protein
MNEWFEYSVFHVWYLPFHQTERKCGQKRDSKNQANVFAVPIRIRKKMGAPEGDL